MTLLQNQRKGDGVAGGLPTHLVLQVLRIEGPGAVGLERDVEARLGLLLALLQGRLVHVVPVRVLPVEAGRLPCADDRYARRLFSRGLRPLLPRCRGTADQAHESHGKDASGQACDELAGLHGHLLDDGCLYDRGIARQRKIPAGGGPAGIRT